LKNTLFGQNLDNIKELYLNNIEMAERTTRVPRVREVWSLNPGPAKSYTPLQITVRCRFNIYSMQVTVLSWRYDAEIDTANSLHASA